MIKKRITDVVRKKCKLCGKLFVPKRDWQDYCTPKEQKEYHRLLQNEKRYLLKRIEKLEKESAERKIKKED